MGKKKDKKNPGGTGSDIFDYMHGVGEAKSLMKRYDVEGASYGRPQSGGKVRSVDDVKKDIADAMMNDYDTRRSLEAAAMAGNKDAKKFAKKGIKGKNIQDAYGVLRDLKKEYVGGGGMGGAENRASLTQALVKADRENFIADNDAKYAFKTDLEQMQEAKPEEAAPVEDSKELAEAKERVQQWEQSNSGVTGDPSPYGSSGDSMFSDSASAVYGQSEGAEAASRTASQGTNPDSYLEAFKAGLKQKKNFQPTL